MRGDLLTLATMAAVAAAGSNRGRTLGSASRRPRYAYGVTYEIIDPGDEHRDPEVTERGWVVRHRDLPVPDDLIGPDYQRWSEENQISMPIGEADDDEIREVFRLGDEVDVSHAPAWLRAAISFSSKAIDEGYTEPSSTSGTCKSFYWRDHDQDYRTGESRMQAMHFTAGLKQGSILGLRVEHDEWPDAAKSLATLLIRNDGRLPSLVMALSRVDDDRVFRVNPPSKWDLELEERIRPDLASALGVPERALIPVF